MGALPSPLLFSSLSLIVEVLIRQLLAGSQLVLGRRQDSLQEIVAIQREGSARPSAYLFGRFVLQIGQEIPGVSFPQSIAR